MYSDREKEIRACEEAKKNQIEKSYDEIDNSVKRMTRSLVFTIAAVVALALLILAWFVSNNFVQGVTTMLGAKDLGVELKSEGQGGVHDDILQKIAESEGKGTTFYSIIDGITSPVRVSANWLLNDESNMGNYDPTITDSNEYWEQNGGYNNSERRKYAIEPGSNGRLNFSVVPKKDGDINLEMKLESIPYKVSETGKITEIIDRESDATSTGMYADGFCKGHILFFLVDESNNLTWLKDGTFDISIDNAVKDNEYPYTVYWCWPQTFAEIVLKSGDKFINGKTPILSTYSNGETVRGEIATDLGNNPNKFFYSNLTKHPLATTDKERNQVSQISGIWAKAANSLTETEKETFVELSSYYNQADQYMGSNVNCIRAQLTATQAAE